MDERQLLANLKGMAQKAEDINHLVSVIWEGSGGDLGDYTSYKLGEEMCAVYYLIKTAIEVLSDLIENVAENVDEEDPNMDKQPTPDTVFVELVGLSVLEVYDHKGNPTNYETIDHDCWENEECPFCGSANVSHVCGVKEETPEYIRTYGGHMQCDDCGCDEETDVVEWIKSHQAAKIDVYENV